MQWIILLGHEVCAIGFEKITCLSSFCQVAKSKREPDLYLLVNSSEFRNVSSGDSNIFQVPTIHMNTHNNEIWKGENGLQNPTVRLWVMDTEMGKKKT